MCCKTAMIKVVSDLLLTRENFSKFKKAIVFPVRVTEKNYNHESSFNYESIIKTFLCSNLIFSFTFNINF